MTAIYHARPTTYKGIKMRSRLEALFAEYLDQQGENWAYEPRCFASDQGQYLPDFYSESSSIYWEVKPNSITLEGGRDAFARMHIILASEPDAQLYLMTNQGSYGSPDFRIVHGCTRFMQCGEYGCPRPCPDLLVVLDNFLVNSPPARLRDPVLCCPSCRGLYTHLIKSEFDPEEGDLDPRPWVKLTFECEECVGPFHLVIRNHKGWSQMTIEGRPMPHTKARW